MTAAASCGRLLHSRIDRCRGWRQRPGFSELAQSSGGGQVIPYTVGDLDPVPGAEFLRRSYFLRRYEGGDSCLNVVIVYLFDFFFFLL